MRIVEKPIRKNQLLERSEIVFDDAMVKGVADVSKKLLAIDAELHADLEQQLLLDGSNQEDLWGINLYPDADGDDFIEFDSMINVRPRQGNRSRYVEDEQTRRKIVDVVKKWVK